MAAAVQGYSYNATKAGYAPPSFATTSFYGMHRRTTSRPISNAFSYTSTRSTTSSGGGGTSADDVRRKSALLGFESPVKSSMQRAAAALEASERGRLDEERRRERHRVRSAHLIHESSMQEWDEGDHHERLNDNYRTNIDHHEQNNHEEQEYILADNELHRRLRKTRSIPVDMLSPRPEKVSTSGTRSSKSPPSRSTSMLGLIVGGKRSNANSTFGTASKAAGPPRRRVVSHDQISKPSPLRPSPPRATFQALPLLLPLPGQPLPSKFSASTGSSQLLDRDEPKVKEKRERTLSRANSIKNMLKTPSKSNLSKKGSLANLLNAVTSNGASKKNDEENKNASFRRKTSGVGSRDSVAFLSKIPLPSKESASSPDTTASSKKVKKSASTFFRTAMRDIRGGPNDSQERSIGSPVSHTRNSSGGGSSSNGSHMHVKTWKEKIGRVLTGKRNSADKNDVVVIDSPVPTVQFAEKVNLDKQNVSSQLRAPARGPSRIPIASVFPEAGMRRPDSSHLEKRERPQAIYSSLVTEDELSTVRSVNTTYSAPLSAWEDAGVSSQHLSESELARPMTILHGTNPLKSPIRIQPYQAQAKSSRGDSENQQSIYRANEPPSALLPAAQLQSGSNHLKAIRPDSLGSSDGEGTASVTSSDQTRRSFRSPSPARFRDLIPSSSAGSSPNRNELNLPMPDDSPRSLTRKSPKKAAMGPEQVIAMGLLNPSTDAGITEVFGATSDLADLLSSLDDSVDISQTIEQLLAKSPAHKISAQDLSASLRMHLLKQESQESLKSNVSDVPDDLRLLIQSVSDHISEVEIEAPDFDMLDSMQAEKDLTDQYETIRGLPAGFYVTADNLQVADARSHESSTVSSFEGHVTTAAMALRSMLNGPGPGEPEPPYTKKQSVASTYSRNSSIMDYIRMERPAVGEKMMERMDIEVSLTSLVAAHSPPPSPLWERGSPDRRMLHGRNLSQGTSSDPTTSSFGSPTPANGLRSSIAPYANGRLANQTSRPVLGTYDSSSSEDSHRPPSPPLPDATNLSFAQSTRSTNLSISSLRSSPCPAPRQRRVPMLTRNAPPTMPDFRFPAKIAPKDQAKVTPQMPTAIRKVGSRAETKSTSPFKRSFNPLAHFKARQRDPLPSNEEPTEIQVKVSLKASPRFERNLQSRAESLSLEEEKRATVEALPCTSSSASDRDSMSIRSNRSSVTSVRVSIDLGRPARPPSVASRTRGHVRQASRASSLLQDVIPEEEGLTASPFKGASPIKEALEEAYDPDYSLLLPVNAEESYSASEASISFARPRIDDTSFEQYENEENDDCVRKWYHFSYEAETEVKRSQALWPSSERSSEILARFRVPTNTYEILQFIFDSQNTFTSLFDSQFGVFDHDSALLPVPLLPPVSHRLLSPSMTDDSPDQNEGPCDVPRSPSPLPLIPTKKRAPLGEKPMNRQVMLTKSMSSPPKNLKENLSPFTALPNPVGKKLRILRAKLSPRKTVDIGFLGSSPTHIKRRKTQFDAARRKLEGRGRPEEQRSDEETDDEDSSGVFEAAGEAHALVNFPSASRPRVRRRMGLSHLR